MSKPKKPGRDPKNLTFAPIVVAKAEEIRGDTGEKWAVMCARLITEEYDRKFPCTCRDALRAKAQRKTPPNPKRKLNPSKVERSLVTGETPPSPSSNKGTQAPAGGKSSPDIREA